MAILLHLSDLHLSTRPLVDTLSDDKERALPIEARQSRVAVIKDTLASMREWLSAQNEVIDCIFISGDILNQSDAEGIDLLEDVLQSLDDALPPPSRILLTPGNHDVVWDTPPSSQERYERFVPLRDKYRLALLDGIDIDSNGLALTSQSPIIVGHDNSYVLAAINSANYCGTRPVLPASLHEAVARLQRRARADEDIKALLADWTHRTLHDIARVDRG